MVALSSSMVSNLVGLHDVLDKNCSCTSNSGSNRTIGEFFSFKFVFQSQSMKDFSDSSLKAIGRVGCDALHQHIGGERAT